MVVLNRLEGKVVLVTGSGRGFGRGMAYAYAREGANVAVAARTVNELTSLKESIEKKGGECLITPTDLSKVDDLNRLRDTIENKFGRLDVLVNNAATSPWKLFEETSVEEWDKTISVNLRAPFILSKLFLPMMKKQGKGSIINVSSASAQIGFVAEVGYCPSKFGLEGLTQCLAMELYPYNIAVNSLNVAAPEGKRLKPTELTLSEASMMPEEVRKMYADDESMADAFSEAWAFMALQNAHDVTGQRLGTKQLADFLRMNGWDAAVATWRAKLTKAVYVTYDLPEKVRYQTPEGGIKELFFKR
ncbi:MAG: SDR family oxidoreductase [Candidatus Bathyarchaeia archaeon]|jgi:NAD(P)-dependent dehydrogenase (short-subunit alcohol dehydrogenase family)